MRAAVLAAVIVSTVAAAPAAAAERVGESVEGRPIALTRLGDPAGETTVLVVGSIHGTEPAGHAVVRRLRSTPVPPGIRLLLLRSANPDGVARGTRQNARGVDLNRNFPYRWRGGGRPFDTYHPGPGPGSEPETRALRRLVRRERPDVTVWYHQALRLVTLVPGADAGLIRAYGRRTGLPAHVLPRYRGTATSWQNHTFPGTTAFVVELAAGPLSAAEAHAHADAVLAVASRAAERTAAAATLAAAGRRAFAPTRGTARAPARRAAGAGRHAATALHAAPRPPIEARFIPFGPDRRRQMRAYSRRHYGDDTARLDEPKAIVEHYTASTSYESAWNTFASNAPDPELHERPGVCAHFLIDTDGTITQLVALGLRCRHTIGLNHVAIGIEHVGVSDASVMGNRRQLRASLELTRWLQDRFGIATADVIGHAESLTSPYHHERVASLRRRTHGDFAAPAMRRYRALLRARGGSGYRSRP